MAFAQVKWDLKDNVPKESDTTESDFILYVRQKIYKQQTKRPPEEEEDEEPEGELASDYDQAGKQLTTEVMPSICHSVSYFQGLWHLCCGVHL